jgi:hypothetical protein
LLDTLDRPNRWALLSLLADVPVDQVRLHWIHLLVYLPWTAVIVSPNIKCAVGECVPHRALL